MSSAIRLLLVILVAGATATSLAASLRICSDPDNLPYSNNQEQGFENKIANLIADDLDVTITYFWFPQRSAFFRKTLNSGACDVVMGVPTGFGKADVTQPYYRSSYVFVTRADRHLGIRSLDDPRLRTLRVGVQVLDEQKDSLPPVHALLSRGIAANLVAFDIFGDPSEKEPTAALIRAVEENRVDVALVWGPLAGYFQRTSKAPLDMISIPEDRLRPDLPFSFTIGIGVRSGDEALKATLDKELLRLHPQIEQILEAYGVPEANTPTTVAKIAEKQP